MLTRHEGRDYIVSVEAIPLELLRDCVRSILILVERELEVTSVELVVLNGLIFIEISSFSFTDRRDIDGIAIREILDHADKLHSIKLIKKQFLDLARPKLRPNEILLVHVGNTGHGSLSPD